MLLKRYFNALCEIFNFYKEGFMNLKLGKTLWKIIIIKLLVMFLFIKMFLFDNTINSAFNTQKEKTNFVIKNLTKEE
ncbi:DUF4492 domain-containing protein [Campylobacter sp. US33a]|uniref:DUF4492 domain-containing protein n=1 Tax=Campylobacter sp. CCS1377 TaxID=3158229 RepID=A0AAU7E692_9BACT|nr:DUF4492 domain-containing protein [Campylobacter sp. US33a]MCW1359974.1 DUF4492 domain-containing protein [Campylobacter jejuni]TEY03159.1 DUF4492 domain-containing protein [Campylobacter sp. US33a]